MLLFDEVQRAITQIIGLCLLPFIVWIIRNIRHKSSPISFLQYVGLRKITILDKRKFTLGILAALMVGFSMSLVLDPMLPDDFQLANSRYMHQGIDALLPALIFSFLATGLPEEVLFRGFIGKQLSKRFGFLVGNTIQAFIFGLLHGCMLYGRLGFIFPTLLLLYTGTLGWLMGYINKQANDSILASWILHGVFNTYAVLLIMFHVS